MGSRWPSSGAAPPDVSSALNSSSKQSFLPAASGSPFLLTGFRSAVGSSSGSLLTIKQLPSGLVASSGTNGSAADSRPLLSLLLRNRCRLLQCLNNSYFPSLLRHCSPALLQLLRALLLLFSPCSSSSPLWIRRPSGFLSLLCCVPSFSPPFFCNPAPQLGIRWLCSIPPTTLRMLLFGTSPAVFSFCVAFSLHFFQSSLLSLICLTSCLRLFLLASRASFLGDVYSISSFQASSNVAHGSPSYLPV